MKPDEYLKIHLPTLFSALLLLIVLNASGHPCDSLDQLIQNKQITSAKSFIFKILRNNPVQENCFYRKSLQVYESSVTKTSNGADTLFMLLTIWKTVDNSCETFNTEAEYYYLCKKFTDLKYDPSYFIHGFLRCKQYNFSPTAVLTLTHGLTKGRNCEPEKIILEYIQLHPDLLKQQLWDSVRNVSVNALLACPDGNCQMYDSLFLTLTGQYKLFQLKKINNILLQKKCTHTPLYKSTSEKILSEEPSFGGLYQFAEQNLRNGELSTAFRYFGLAEKHTSDSSMKALCYKGVAEIFLSERKLEKAKEFAQIAAKLNPENIETYLFLAQLLKKAETICNFKETELTGLNLLISKNYKLAKKHDEAEKYYRLSKAEELMREGKIKKRQTITLGCYINEEVELTK